MDLFRVLILSMWISKQDEVFFCITTNFIRLIQLIIVNPVQDNVKVTACCLAERLWAKTPLSSSTLMKAAQFLHVSIKRSFLCHEEREKLIKEKQTHTIILYIHIHTHTHTYTEIFKHSVSHIHALTLHPLTHLQPQRHIHTTHTHTKNK